MLPAVGMANEMHRKKKKKKGKGWKLKPKKQINDQMRNVCCKVNTMREEKGDQERVKFLLMNISVCKKQRQWWWPKGEARKGRS